MRSELATLYQPNQQVKEIEIIHRLFLVIAMYCQASSSQFKPVQSITQPPTLLAGWVHAVGSNSLETTYILFELPYSE